MGKNKSDNKNFFVITVIKNKDFFLKKIKFKNKNIFFLYQKNSKVDFDTNYNIFSYPVHDPQRYGVIELDKKNNPYRLTEKPKKPKSNLSINAWPG